MWSLDVLDTLFVLFAFFIQIALIIHFALRRWAFATAMKYGRLVYALAVPAAALSMAQFVEGEPWYMVLAGALFTLWALFGYTVEYLLEIEWRSGPYLRVFLPYAGLYVAAICFYWWSLALIDRRLWYVYGLLFLISTVLNALSHAGPADREGEERPRYT